MPDQAPRPLTQSEIATSVQRIAVAAHSTARARGYYQGSTRSPAESIAFAVRELGYALSDVRRSRPLTQTVIDVKGKPRGFGVAVARCVIRLADMCAANGVDLGAAMAAEMAHNARRAKRG